MYRNPKVSVDKTILKRELSEALPGGFSETDYDVEYLINNLEKAIKRARTLDANPRERSPNQLGTRVYRLAEKIRKGK